jgi:hypothetical protein
MSAEDALLKFEQEDQKAVAPSMQSVVPQRSEQECKNIISH